MSSMLWSDRWSTRENLCPYTAKIKQLDISTADQIKVSVMMCGTHTQTDGQTVINIHNHLHESFFVLQRECVMRMNFEFYWIFPIPLSLKCCNDSSPCTITAFAPCFILPWTFLFCGNTCGKYLKTNCIGKYIIKTYSNRFMRIYMD